MALPSKHRYTLLIANLFSVQIPMTHAINGFVRLPVGQALKDKET